MSDSYKCPQCSSENTQRISLIHAQGTSQSSMTGIGYVDGLAVGMGVGSKQTDLAKRLAPPELDRSDQSADAVQAVATGRGSLVCVGMTLVFLVRIPQLLINGQFKQAAVAFIGFLAIGALAGLFCYGFYLYATKVHPKSVATRARKHAQFREDWTRWSRTMLCHRCGCIFDPDSPITANRAE